MSSAWHSGQGGRPESWSVDGAEAKRMHGELCVGSYVFRPDGTDHFSLFNGHSKSQDYMSLQGCRKAQLIIYSRKNLKYLVNKLLMTILPRVTQWCLSLSTSEHVLLDTAPAAS